jgi:hypothetical protein
LGPALAEQQSNRTERRDPHDHHPPHHPRDSVRTPEQMIDLYRIITMNNLDVRTIAPAHGFGPRPYDNLKKAIGLIPM